MAYDTLCLAERFFLVLVGFPHVSEVHCRLDGWDASSPVGLCLPLHAHPSAIGLAPRHAHRIPRKQPGLTQASLLHFPPDSPRLQVDPASRGQREGLWEPMWEGRSKPRERRCRQGMTMGRQSITNAGAQVPLVPHLAKEFRPPFL